MERIANPPQIQDMCWHWRSEGKIIALVPTMGYFHAGHLSLISWARENADKVIVSLFVNPTQFGPKEDLEAYPRDLERDAALAGEHGADILFIPPAAKMYLPGFCTWVEAPELATTLCGQTRPTHFRGVATVVTKLLLLTVPTFAVFGEKDFQQLVIIRRVARDLNIRSRIVGRPIVREEDGLAMSSRNIYLSPEERVQAPAIQRGLQVAQQMVQKGERDVSRLRAAVTAYYEKNMPLGKLDYLEFADPETMQPVELVSAPTLAAVAIYFGKARLIDNLVLEAGKSA